MHSTNVHAQENNFVDNKKSLQYDYSIRRGNPDNYIAASKL